MEVKDVTTKSMPYEAWKDNEYIEKLVQELRDSGTNVLVGSLDKLINWGRSNSICRQNFSEFHNRFSFLYFYHLLFYNINIDLSIQIIKNAAKSQYVHCAVKENKNYIYCQLICLLLYDTI